MKKGVLFAILFIFVLMTLSMGNVLAEEDKEASKDIADLKESERIDLAYQCLRNNIGNLSKDSKKEDKDEGITKDDCEKLTPEAKAFVLMTLGECKEELIKESKKDGLCWPKGNCNPKATAQAIWALNSDGEDTKKAEKWLLEDQKGVPRDLIWYLQIETENQSLCEITYITKDGGTETHTTEISEDRTVASGAGECLKVSENGYWLKINPACYDYRYEIKCVKGSFTSLFFKEDDKENSPLHVLDDFKSAVAGVPTIQQIKSFCFLGEDGCDYEGTLWATMALDILDYDVSEYIPYLTTGENSNLNLNPSPFLYALTAFSDHKTNILSRQINSQYWEFENGKYFDTALSMFPFQEKDISEKKDAKEWLFEVQGKDGCWKGGDIRDNAFLLYSMWQRPHTGTSKTDDDPTTKTDNAKPSCTSKGFFCMSGLKCVDADKLPEFKCNTPSKCCKKPIVEPTCAEIPSGVLCSENQYCSLGSKKILDEGTCCVGGTCVALKDTPKQEPNDKGSCTSNSGVCEKYTCGEDTIESTEYICSGTSVCCVEEKSKANYVWIWILFVLIVLIVIGIIYRDKLKELFNEMQHGKKPAPKEAQRRGPGSPGQPGRGMPSRGRPTIGMPSRGRPSPTGMSRPPIQTRPLLNQKPTQLKPPISRPNSGMRPRPAQKSPKELDSVLKKLKEMSK